MHHLSCINSVAACMCWNVYYTLIVIHYFPDLSACWKFSLLSWLSSRAMHQCPFNIHYKLWIQNQKWVGKYPSTNLYSQRAFRENNWQAIKSTKQVWKKAELRERREEAACRDNEREEKGEEKCRVDGGRCEFTSLLTCLLWSDYRLAGDFESRTMNVTRKATYL